METDSLKISVIEFISIERVRFSKNCQYSYTHIELIGLKFFKFILGWTPVLQNTVTIQHVKSHLIYNLFTG